ncbi:unnamed protein product (macronuclear) [Paramecium tetraurelia]|uniref:60S ribosomal export protein NMD3 n=1 Tax=Paramecium tetraurelia TaxID=5888 RepID=A0EGF4_PARTE|nr:uncharacterized protein GSPATT00026719001 [Paramecium tetraurelia]CAK94395.1 unnamed protein product [Paramecium tetraurelia]|eukprot:XP_001461768.1 hypothetical protein (macronuclear) [Paramecium tetraurelia strain d4-2]
MMETENQQIGNQIKPKTTILCSICDLAFTPSEQKTLICTNCIINQTDITVGITKEGIVNYCRFCHRYLRPPWTLCERESKELLSICLKRLRGLNKVKIIDAAFVYTEPSSKRIKVKLTIQKEVLNNTNMQQTFICEFVEHYQQCEDCKKEFTPHTWGAAVQVRQRVDHKKTFFYLEQLLLKYNANDKVLKIEQVDDGLDFFYKSRSHANRLVEYLSTILPIRVKQSKQLVSHDASSNLFNYKYVYAVDLPKVCKDDLVILPQKLCKELGGVGRVQLCYKLTTIIYPLKLFLCMKMKLKSITLKTHQHEFTVVDVERIHTRNLNESYISITIIRESNNYVPVTVKSHLGDILKTGQVAIGYDLTQLTIESLEDISNYPECILVKRQINKEARKLRIFKLKRLEAQNVMEEEGGERKRNQQKKQNDQEEQFEEFLDDVEKDKEMRKNINLYRDEDKIKKLSKEDLKKKQKKQVQQQKKDNDDEWQDDDEDDVKLEDLMKDLNLEDKPELAEPVDEAQDEINQFITKLEKVTIEK